MSNENNALTLENVTALVNDFRDTYLPTFEREDNDLAVQIRNLNEKRNNLTYDMVAALVALAIKLNVKAQSGVYKSFLVERGIPLAKLGHNVYLPFIKAIFAVKTGENWDFPADQRGREKHANHVRFLVDAIVSGACDPEKVQDYISTYDKKLQGIEAQDRIDNPNAAQALRVAKARENGHKVAPKATFQNAFGHKDGAVVKLYGRIRDGQLEVLEAAEANDNEAESLWYRLGKDVK